MSSPDFSISMIDPPPLPRNPDKPQIFFAPE